MKDILDEQQLLKARSALAVSGRGLLFLTLWNILRDILAFMYGSEWEGLRNMIRNGTSAEQVIIVIVVIMIYVIYGGLFCYVGFRAIAEGHGRHVNNRFIVLSGIYMIFLLVEIVLVCILWCQGQSSFLAISQLPLELISFSAVTDLFVNAVKIRRYEKNHNTEGR